MKVRRDALCFGVISEAANIPAFKEGTDMKLLDFMLHPESHSLRERLEMAPYDALCEIDLSKNQFISLYHLESRLFLPVRKSAYSDIFRYTLELQIHPEDRSVYQKLMDPETLAQRLKDAPNPGLLSDRFRYRQNDGTWYWVEQILLSGPDHGLPENLVRCFVFDVNNQVDREMGICTFTPSRKSEEEYHILVDFRRALQSGEFFFMLQPQCRISNHRIVGAESLARWRAADGHMIPPSVFIPILEKNGFITELDQYIWEQVVRWIRSWQDRGHVAVPISINISPIDILSLDIPAHLSGLTDRYGVSHDLLKVEITESAYTENTAVIRETVRRLQDLGFMVLMDDFGSGYSSLNMLGQLSVDVLKVDTQFLRMKQDETEERSIRILESVVGMAKNMGIPIIVEGVETNAQAVFLHDLGCRYIQGFHFYRPMEVVDFETLIANENLLEKSGIVFNSTQQFRLQELLNQNVYSDTMLNNILGGIAVYSRYGEDGKSVDIIRYNEQFYQTVNVPDFNARIVHIERFIHPADLDTFYGLMNRSEEDHLNGASGLLGIYRTDGSLGYYLLRYYYLEKNEESRKYFGVIQDLTSFVRQQKQIQLLSRFTPETIVFLYRREGKSFFKVAIHGLEKILGIDASQFQKELNDRVFHERIVDQSDTSICDLIAGAITRDTALSVFFTYVHPDGQRIPIYLLATPVHDEYSDVEYIINFRTSDG